MFEICKNSILLNNQLNKAVGVDCDDSTQIDHEHYSEHRGLCSLWRAVIMQAVLDSVNNSQRTENKVAKQNAKYWLTRDSKDLDMVCHFAEYNKNYVKYKAKAIISANECGKYLGTNNNDNNNIFQNQQLGSMRGHGDK